MRKHRKNDVDAFRKLQQLRRDFETARDLCALARRRETVRRLRGDASRGRLRRALDTLAKQRGGEALPDQFPFADQDEDYRLTPNEVAAALHDLLTGHILNVIAAGGKWNKPALKRSLRAIVLKGLEA